MAHTRRKFFELHATNKSMLAEQALRYIQWFYEIEGEVRDLEADLRRRIRPWAPGRKSWLFTGSLRSGKHAAAIMSLIQSARGIVQLLAH